MKKSDTNSRSRIAGNNAVSRRTFTRGLLAAGITAAIKPLVPAAMANSGARIEYDYIVVGAGAGGGPVAARLANAGYTVALLEAGVDPEAQDTVNFALPPGVPDSGTTYQIPALAGVSAEHPLLSWDFYVKHYSDPAQQLRDLNYVKNPANPDKQGILYPRGSTLGGIDRSRRHGLRVSPRSGLGRYRRRDRGRLVVRPPHAQNLREARELRVLQARPRPDTGLTVTSRPAGSTRRYLSSIQC